MGNHEYPNYALQSSERLHSNRAILGKVLSKGGFLFELAPTALGIYAFP